MIEIITDPDVELWERFVLDHARGNIFQTSTIAGIYKNTKNYSPITFAAVDSTTDEILSIVNAVIIKEFTGAFDQLTARSIIAGGPLFLDSDRGKKATMDLMKYYDTTISKQAIYTEIRNLWNLKDQISLPGYVYEEHLNFLIDLTIGKEKLWVNLSKARKYGINKSKKAGVEIQEMKSPDELPILYDLLRDTYKKARLPLADSTLFESLFPVHASAHPAKVFFAMYKGEYIGAIVLLIYNQMMYDWYACSKKESSQYYPNDRLVWHALEWGCDNHYTVFDFMGAGKPTENYGVRDFKKQFGGALVNFGRFKKVHSPTKMWLTQKGFPVYRHFLR